MVTAHYSTEEKNQHRANTKDKEQDKYPFLVIQL